MRTLQFLTQTRQKKFPPDLCGNIPVPCPSFFARCSDSILDHFSHFRHFPATKASVMALKRWFSTQTTPKTHDRATEKKMGSLHPYPQSNLVCMVPERSERKTGARANLKSFEIQKHNVFSAKIVYQGEGNVPSSADSSRKEVWTVTMQLVTLFDQILPQNRVCNDL